MDYVVLDLGIDDEAKGVFVVARIDDPEVAKFEGCVLGTYATEQAARRDLAHWLRLDRRERGYA